MRLVTLVLLVLTASGPASISPNQSALMDEIERTIVLPKGANPLNAYGRNYAFSGPNNVVGIYLLPTPRTDLSKPGSCEKLMLPNFTPRPCTKQEIEEEVRRGARAFAAQTPAGKRRWYSDVSGLPGISDGGCMQINVAYEISTHRFLGVVCNGLI